MDIKKTVYNQSKSILKYVDHYVNVPCTVSDAGVSADANGRKIVKAGSLLDKNGAVKNDATAVGVLFYDVDVTSGPRGGALLVHGFVDVAKMPVEPADTVDLPMVMFVK